MDDLKLKILLHIHKTTPKKILMLHEKYKSELVQVIDSKIDELVILIETLPEWVFEKNNNHKGAI